MRGGNQEGRVQRQGQQVPGRRHQLYRAPEFRRLPRGQPFQRHNICRPAAHKNRTKLAGADAIYVTNKNRTLATSNGIRTDFKRKGWAGKHEKQRKKLAAAITKERASRLEGSFGKDKEHYHLKKVKARTKATETLGIFFGIHTGNALEIGRRMAEALQKAA